MRGSVFWAAWLVAVSLTRGQQDVCQQLYTVAPGMSNTAVTLAETAITDLAACQAACDASSNCAGFDFKTVDSTCYLTMDAKAATIEVTLGTNHYYRQQACSLGEFGERCFFDYRGEHVADTQFGPLRGVPDITSCIQACLLFTTCGGVSYDPANSECFVAPAAVADLYTAAEGTGKQFYQFVECNTVPLNAVCVRTYLMAENMAVENGQFSPNNRTVADCEAYCDAVTECISFDFNLLTDNCWIHIDPTQDVVSKNNVDHYSEALVCESTDMCTYISRGAYSPPATADSMSEPGVITLSECLAACNDNITCVGVSYNEVYNYNCQLYYTETDVDGSMLESSTDGTYTYSQQICQSSTTTTLQPTVAPGTCGVMYAEQASRKASGANRKTAGSPVDDCLGLCSGDADCTGVDYNTADLSCWHHYEPYPPTVASNIGSESHYDKYLVCDGCEFDYYPGTTVAAGVAVLALPGSLSEFECIQRCITSVNCRGAVYQNSNIQACSLVTGDPSNTAADSAKNLYVNTKCDNDVEGCDVGYQLYANQKIPFGRQIDADTVEECQLDCDLENECIGYDFNSISQCFLITEYKEIRAENGVQHFHAMPICNGTARTECSFFATKPYLPSDNTYTELTILESACFIACVDDVDCSGFVYDSSICYLYPSTTSWAFADLQESSSTSLVAYELISCDPTESTSATTITTTPAGETTLPGCINTWTPQEHQHVSNGLPQPGTVTVEECQSICLTLADCTAVDHKGGDLKCWVHTDPDVLDNVRPETGVTFYFLERCVTPSTTEETTPTETSSPSSMSTEPEDVCTSDYEEFTKKKKVPTATLR